MRFAFQTDSFRGVVTPAVVIPKPPKKGRGQITIRLDRDVLQNLEHYCRYLESGCDYVINQRLALIFRKDQPIGICPAGKGMEEATQTNGAAAQAVPGKAARGSRSQRRIMSRYPSLGGIK
jgi:hypothetical protein